MATERAWPPKSPRAALLSSPSGRRKYLSGESDYLQRAPLKPSASTPNLLERLRAARTNNDYLGDMAPQEDGEEDEETLKLQLAAIEAKLKLKKLQQSKTKSEVPRAHPRTNDAVVIGASPTKRPIPSLEPRSPSRVLLGIDKGMRGADVSLRRVKSTSERSKTRPSKAIRPTSRVSGLGSQRSTASNTGVSSVKSFSDRMAAVRDKDRNKDALRSSAALGRSKSFKLDKEEVETYRRLTEEEPKRNRSPVRPPAGQAYSRDDILKAKADTNGGLRMKKSRTEADLRQPPSRPSSRGVGGETADPSSEGDPGLFESFSGLHLASRILPHSFLKRTLPREDFTTFRIPDLLREVKSPDYDLPNGIGDYVVFGVIASKSTPRDHAQKVEEKSIGTKDWERKWEDGSQNQRKFIVMTITDLQWSLDLYLFGTAVPRYHRMTPRTVVAILNPAIMPPKKGKEDSGAFSLALHDGDDAVLEIGTAKHLGYCNVLRKDGKECGQWVNATKTEICEWHLNQQLHKTQSGRMGVNTGSNGSKLNSRNFIFDSRAKGSREGQGRTGLLPRQQGEKYNPWNGSYFISGSNAGPNTNSGPNGRNFDDPFLAEGSLSEARDKKTLLKLRQERQQKEDDIAKKLSTFEAGRAGSEYLRHRTGASTPAGTQRDSEAGSQRSGLSAKENIMKSRSDANESRKRAADSVRLSPVKKTRFLTEKGIRLAGRESLGVTKNDDDDLEIV